ncbi:MAG: hypothetical protein EHM58_02345 [Ignavibacteriae bacterium]|nr:MAG: hypothetical protein EHM58_02345 [Ignavibacteriota bacterium]
MKSVYKILFSIDVYHDYYNSVNDISFIEITPAPDTIEKLRNFKVISKTFPNKLLTIIEVNDNKPFIKIPEDTSFRFYLKALKPEFQNVSALKTFGIGNSIYYFTNRSNNKLDDKLYLSKPVPLYDANSEYETGSLVQNNTSIFEAIKSLDNNSSHDINNQDFWRELSNNRFLTYDKLNHTDIHKGEIRSDNDKIYEAVRFISKNRQIDITDNNFWNKLNKLQYVTNDDLINKEALEIKESVPGVIDLFFDNNVPPEFSIINSEGNVMETNYQIRFKNRIATWKYISQNNSINNIEDVKKIFTFTRPSIDSNEFVSNTPIPLIARPDYNFKITAGNITTENIKCPAATVIPDKENKSFVSEIYLNY